MISADRIACVELAWNHVACGKDSISFEELKKKHNSTNHPRVVTREKKPDTIECDFCEAMGCYVKDGCISKDAFCSYYRDINAVLPAEKEAYFINLVRCNWNIAAKSVAVAGDPTPKLEE